MRPGHIHQGVVDNPVAKRRGRDQALLGLMDVEADIAPRRVGFVGQLTLQANEFVAQAQLEARDLVLAAFAARGFLPGR